MLKEFQGEFGDNEDKLSSFELFRKNINNPEIIDWTSLELDTDYISFNKRKSRSIARTYFTEVYKK